MAGTAVGSFAPMMTLGMLSALQKTKKGEYLSNHRDYALWPGWGLRMADLQTATQITTAYEGGLPTTLSQQGGVILGMGSDNSANAWGTFFEGAIVRGWPADETELAIMENVQAVGYGE